MKKKYYWIKLKQSLLTSDKVDFLMSQKDGANYIVLYQCLCLMCANTNGVLGKEIGEVLIPYDTDKIQRDTKWFTKDTIIVALELYKKLGLIYQADNGLLQITDFDELVGSYVDNPNANRQRKFRENQKQNVISSVTKSVTKNNVDIDNRYKDIDKDIDNINLKENKKETLTETELLVTVPTIKEFLESNRITANYFSLTDYINENKIENWQEYILNTCKKSKHELNVNNVKEFIKQHNLNVDYFEIYKDMSLNKIENWEDYLIEHYGKTN